MEKHKHALKIGIKWQKIANSSIWHRLQWLQCRQHGQSERKDDGKYCPHDAVAELHTRREENLQLWFSVTLLVQPSEQKPVTGETAVAREYKGWMSASVKILTTTLLQRVFVVTRRWHYWCPSCNLCHILPEMTALFFNHKTPSCTCRRNSRFFFKGHLATDALNSPSPAQYLHLELQPEQLGEFEGKQVKDILCAFKALLVKFCRYVMAIARDTSPHTETIPLSCSAMGSTSEASSYICLHVFPLQADVAVQHFTLRTQLC